MELTILSHSEPETEALGCTLGQLLGPGDTIALIGVLGAGKTCLTRGMAHGLGITEPVTSPTFILIGEYATAQGFPLYHADCYRLANPTAEAQDIGLEELMAGRGVCVVEWAERIQPLWPADCLVIRLTALEENIRQATLAATGPRSQALLAQLETRWQRRLCAEEPLHVASA